MAGRRQEVGQARGLVDAVVERDDETDLLGRGGETQTGGRVVGRVGARDDQHVDRAGVHLPDERGERGGAAVGRREAGVEVEGIPKAVEHVVQQGHGQLERDAVGAGAGRAAGQDASLAAGGGEIARQRDQQLAVHAGPRGYRLGRERP